MLKGKVFIGTPTYRRNVVNDYAFSLMRDAMGSCAAALWYVAPPCFRDDTLVHFSRNWLLDAFLSSEADYCVMIDADMGWEAGGLLKLLETPGDIVGGIYRGKVDKPFYPFHAPDGLDATVNPWGEVGGVPGGFMKISRRAAHRVLADFPRPFGFEIDEHGEWGEDLIFCKRAKLCGLSVVARTDIEFTHVGMNAWTGRYCDAVNNGEI